MPSNQNKYYCFTNHVVETIYRWNHFDWVQFAVWQLERSSNGSYHHQGYVELSRRMTMTAVRSLLGEHAHISPRRGTRKEAINYCTKEETRVAGPWCWGELVQNSQGERTDLYSLRELLVRGTSISTMIEEHFHLWARHHTVIEKWFQYAESGIIGRSSTSWLEHSVRGSRQLRVLPLKKPTASLLVFGLISTMVRHL